MATQMQVDLVSPERQLASVTSTAVEIPGSAGDMTVMAEHQPTVTGLRPGILRIHGEKGTEEYVVFGGFAQIGENISILAEEAHRLADMSEERMKTLMQSAQEAAQNAEGAAKDSADKLVDDLRVLAGQRGWNVA